jgi:Ice-binding-like
MRRSLISFGLAASIVLIWPATALASSDPLLGASGNYAVLAAASITNTGPSWITGQLALSPGTSVVGFPPGTVGHEDIANGAALNARNDARIAYNNAKGEAPTRTLTGSDLGSVGTLTPGVFFFSSSAGLTGTLTLSGGGIYIFQIGSTLTTASSSRVVLTGGAQPCDIFWQVGSSATIGGATAFVGNILANTSITMVTAATLNGRALAGLITDSGALTLDTNRIIQPSGCPGGFTTSFPAPAFVPPPAGNILPATLGVPWELINEIPWLLVIAVGAGFGATVLVVSNRRRRRNSA